MTSYISKAQKSNMYVTASEGICNVLRATLRFNQSFGESRLYSFKFVALKLT